jgi:hypothetical protein
MKRCRGTAHDDSHSHTAEHVARGSADGCPGSSAYGHTYQVAEDAARGEGATKVVPEDFL